jgi:hypothetical protein
VRCKDLTAKTIGQIGARPALGSIFKLEDLIQILTAQVTDIREALFRVSRIVNPAPSARAENSLIVRQKISCRRAKIRHRKLLP